MSMRKGAASSAVEIQVANLSAGNELIARLWRHGLPGDLVERAGRWQVEIRPPREEPQQLLSDLLGAVESLLPDRAGSGLLLRVGEGRYELRSHSDR
jgi:hypothetical protein